MVGEQSSALDIKICGERTISWLEIDAVLSHCSLGNDFYWPGVPRVVRAMAHLGWSDVSGKVAIRVTTSSIFRSSRSPVGGYVDGRTDLKHERLVTQETMNRAEYQMSVASNPDMVLGDIMMYFHTCLVY